MNPTDRALSRTPRAAAQGAPARPACGYLHGNFGPGCPYCVRTPHETPPHSLTVQTDLIRAGFTRAERAAFLAAWDKPAGEWTEAERVLIDRYEARRAA